MNLLSKAYLLIAILIGAAAINLLLFYTDSNSQTTQSYSIIRVGDVKVSAESISSLVHQLQVEMNEIKKFLMIKSMM